MKSNIKFLIEKLTIILNDFKGSLESNKMNLSDDTRKLIEQLPVLMTLIEDEVRDYGKQSLVNNLASNISINNIKNELISLMLGLQKNDEELNGSTKSRLQDVSRNLMNLNVNLNVILIKLEKEEESFFDDSKIDKKELLEILERTKKTFIEEAKDIKEPEKAKVVNQFNITINEVKKTTTSWGKVLAGLNVLAIASTLYVSTPIIKNDIVEAARKIQQSFKTDIPKGTIPDGLLLENVKAGKVITI